MTSVALSIFVLALLLFGLVLAVSATVMWRQGTHFKETARRERVRSAWAESRAALMADARDGKIRIDSPAFEALYSIQTFILRHPEDYAAIGRRLQEFFGPMMGPPHPHARIEGQEGAKAVLAQLTPEVWTSVAKGIASLIYAYPRLGEFLRLALKIVRPHVVGAVSRRLKRLPGIRTESMLWRMMRQAERMGGLHARAAR